MYLINQLIFDCTGSLLLCVGFLLLLWAVATLCWVFGFSCCGAQTLGTWASVVSVHGLSGWGTQACLLCSTWSLPGPGIESMSPVLADGFSSTELPGKSLASILKHNLKSYLFILTLASLINISLSWSPSMAMGKVRRMVFSYVSSCLSPALCQHFRHPRWLSRLSSIWKLTCPRCSLLYFSNEKSTGSNVSNKS